MPTYLVTGGAGFIGSHLCEALLARGDAVRVLDDLSTGKQANLSPATELIVGDVADRNIVRAAIDGIDGCFHLAAIASVERGVNDWLGTHRTNLTGTITIFDAIRGSAATIPVVYASSAAVYGEVAHMPIAEEAERRPLSAYGADKYACELHARVATHVHRIPTVGLRFFNVYGQRQDPRSPYSGVVSIFCERLQRDAVIDVFGDGEQTRDFVFVTDVVTALLAAMHRQPPGAPVFNVCTGRPISVLELARTIAELTRSRMEIRHALPRAGEIRHSVGSPARAQAMLGLPPPTPLDRGLAAVLSWLAASA